MNKYSNTHTSIKLDKHQQAAVNTSWNLMGSSRRIHCIAGGPGRGKSTIIAEIIRKLKSAGVEGIHIAAPTGKAAVVVNRMLAREFGTVLPVSPAGTIHRMLGCRGGGDWLYNRDDLHPAEVILLDESSMVDVELLHRIQYSTEDECKIIMLGDHNQLAPVGPGCPFLDMVEVGGDKVKVSKLITNYRQVNGSCLADAVENISAGNMVKFCENLGDGLTVGPDGKDADFFFHECEDRDKIADALAENIEPWHKAGKDYLCVVPQKVGPIGYEKLNPILQQRLNPGNGPGVKVYNNVIREGDVVRQTKNDYNLGHGGIFNGYIGRVLHADNKSCIVEYPGWPKTEEVAYTERKQLNNLTLGYAITCHAAQGSQAQYVVYMAHRSNYGMLTNQNIYVGVSRAQKECHIVGQRDMVHAAIKNRRSVKRNTHLGELLSE